MVRAMRNNGATRFHPVTRLPQLRQQPAGLADRDCLHDFARLPTHMLWTSPEMAKNMNSRTSLLLGLVCLVVAGCGSPPMLAARDPAAAAPAGPGVAHVTGLFVGAKGFQLFEQHWRLNNPKGTVVIVHGLKDHSDRYSQVASS